VKYKDIELPKNTAMGIYLAGFVFLFGFAMVWHVIWLILASLIGCIACVTIKSFDENNEYTLTAAQLERMEKDREKYNFLKADVLSS